MTKNTGKKLSGHDSGPAGPDGPFVFAGLVFFCAMSRSILAAEPAMGVCLSSPPFSRWPSCMKCRRRGHHSAAMYIRATKTGISTKLQYQRYVPTSILRTQSFGSGEDPMGLHGFV